ncbi:MAG TPA: glycoside hydrolase family 32 protein [Vicinamibacterales bacterium]|nr:glycoside hydrolase family 32 protein [Vicinamibacterales bacterium]
MTCWNFPRLLAVLPLVSVAACGPGQPQQGPEVEAQTSAVADAAPTYRERFRPQYHFTPPENWMNDPNGMVYFDGEYHLFYQYNPFGDKWGHMSWGHAVSPDLLHWDHLPVAIPEANGVMAFSGSAVVDWNNTSGFGQDGTPPLVAIYTGHRETNQSQYIAYSNNRGRTWIVYDGNPVLDIGRKDFRDPKVFWHEPQQRWVMVVALPDQHKVSFYSSPDLKQWRHLSDFGPAAAVGGIWECPDLFELPVDGDPNDARWVLIVSLNPGANSGGSGMQYFLGHFDGTRFTAESPAPGVTTAGMRDDSVLWADYGRDFYAAVSWSDVPSEDGRRLWLGWMNNWQYAQDIPTSPWRSIQSLPRMLALRTTSRGIRMVQQPVIELQQLRGRRRTLAAQPIAEGTTSLAPQGVAGRALEIVAEFEVGTAAELGLKVRTGNQEETVIGIDPHAGQLFVDRTRSGQVGFHAEFSGRHTAPLPVQNGRVSLHVFVDWSSVEVFAASGEVVVTDLIFPAPESDGVALYARGGTARLVSLDAWPLDSIWRTAAAGERRSTPQ